MWGLGKTADVISHHLKTAYPRGDLNPQSQNKHTFLAILGASKPKADHHELFLQMQQETDSKLLIPQKLLIYNLGGIA